jgi:hypothetical protein
MPDDFEDRRKAENTEIRRLVSTFTPAQFAELMRTTRPRATVVGWQRDPVTYENLILKFAREIAAKDQPP